MVGNFHPTLQGDMNQPFIEHFLRCFTKKVNLIIKNDECGPWITLYGVELFLLNLELMELYQTCHRFKSFEKLIHKLLKWTKTLTNWPLPYDMSWSANLLLDFFSNQCRSAIPFHMELLFFRVFHMDQLCYASDSLLFCSSKRWKIERNTKQ